MFDLVLLLAQDPTALPTTEGLEGDGNLIWVVGLLLAILSISNIYWGYTLRSLKKDHKEHLVEWKGKETAWEVKRGEWETWKDTAHRKMMKLALRTQKAMEVWAGIENDMTEEDD